MHVRSHDAQPDLEDKLKTALKNIPLADIRVHDGGRIAIVQVLALPDLPECFDVLQGAEFQSEVPSEVNKVARDYVAAPPLKNRPPQSDIDEDKLLEDGMRPYNVKLLANNYGEVVIGSTN